MVFLRDRFTEERQLGRSSAGLNRESIFTLSVTNDDSGDRSISTLEG